MNNISNYSTIVVHDGVFHADEVFGVAYMQLMRDHLSLIPLKVIRTHRVGEYMTEENGYIVADIGKTRFDHHFPENVKKTRSNGVPYAAFGLLVKEFHEGFLSSFEYELFDKKFIEPIDYNDNNGGGNQLAFAISVFNKTWDNNDPNTQTVNFFEAVKFAMVLLRRVICTIKALSKAKKIALHSLPDGDTIYLDEYVPITEFLVDSEVMFVGSPSMRGGYQIISIKDSTGNNKKLFPERFRGYNPDGNTSNEYGMTFCHSSGFIASFIDKEHAKKFMDEWRENPDEFD